MNKMAERLRLNSQRSFLDHNFYTAIWFALLLVLLIYPTLIFGLPGFWGDDFNIITDIETTGVASSIANWIAEYGYVYRPIGYGLLALSYKLFASSMTAMYSIIFLTYFGLLCLIYRLSSKVSNNNQIGIGITLIFAFFPFNPTAVLQIASLYMFYAFLLVIMLFIYLFAGKENSGITHKFKTGALWLTILLIYEQGIGLLVLILLFEFVSKYNGRIGETINFVVRKHIVVSGLTILFLLLYFVLPGNPKIISLYDLNTVSNTLLLSDSENPSSRANSDISQTTSEKSPNATYMHNVRSNSFYKSRIEALTSKTQKVIRYFLDNCRFAVNTLIAAGWKSVPLLFIFVFFSLLTKKLLTMNNGTKGNGSKLILFGSVWTLLSVAPFFLYSSLHIPVYSLVLPSIGAACVMHGIMETLLTKTNKWKEIILWSGLLSCSGFFYIQQIGYQAGLRSELIYWAEKARIDSASTGISELSFSIEQQRRTDSHIFWLNKSMLFRHYKDVANMNEDYFQLDDSGVIIRN